MRKWILIAGIFTGFSACTENQAPQPKTIPEQFDSINNSLEQVHRSGIFKTDSLLQLLDSMANH